MKYILLASCPRLQHWFVTPLPWDVFRKFLAKGVASTADSNVFISRGKMWQDYSMLCSESQMVRIGTNNLES